VGAPAAPVPAPRSAPALPQVASSPATEDAVLSQLVKLGAEAPDGLVDAAALVRASGLPMPLARASLLSLAAAGAVELRPAGETTPRPADHEPGYPRTEAGFIVQYVRRLAPPKASRAPAPARGKPVTAGAPSPRVHLNPAQAKEADRLRRLTLTHCDKGGPGTQAKLAHALKVSRQKFGDFVKDRRPLAPELLIELAKALGAPVGNLQPLGYQEMKMGRLGVGEPVRPSIRAASKRPACFVSRRVAPPHWRVPPYPGSYFNVCSCVCCWTLTGVAVCPSVTCRT